MIEINRNFQLSPYLGVKEALRKIYNPNMTNEELLAYVEDCKVIGKASAILMGIGMAGGLTTAASSEHLSTTQQIIDYAASLSCLIKGTSLHVTTTMVAERLVGIGKRRGLNIKIPWYIQEKEPGFTLKRPNY